MKDKSPVSERALIQRINRKLKQDNQMLRATRGDRFRAEQGDYYVIDFGSGFLIEKHVDPEEMGRELEVLAEWERVITD